MVGIPRVRAPDLPGVPATALGCVAGAAAFSALAGAWPAAPRCRRLLTFLPAVVWGAALEEVVWRGYVFGALASVVVAPAALALTSVLFALAHGHIRGRRKLVHVATGAVFGGAYLATGRLGAAIGAHVSYNALVAAGLERRVHPALRARGAPAAHIGGAGPATVPVPRPPAPTAPPVEARALEKRFGDLRALSGVDLRIEPGQVVALLGPNGAGKTTLVSLMLGLRRPDGGEVRLFGCDPRRPAARRPVGAALQDAGFPATLRVRELAAFAAAHFPAAPPTTGLLERFGIGDLGGRQAGGLSAGQRRRLAVALAFAGDPRLVFLDEPTAGLDVEARWTVWEQVRTYAASGGAVLLTTHHLEEAEKLASRVAIIRRGEIVAEGTVAALRADAGLVRVRLDYAGVLPSLSAAVRSEDGPRGVSISTADPARLVEELRAAGVALDGLEVTPLSLEDVFLQLTREGPR